MKGLYLDMHLYTRAKLSIDDIVQVASEGWRGGLPHSAALRGTAHRTAPYRTALHRTAESARSVPPSQAVMSVRDGGRCCFIGISDVKTVAHVPITHVVRRRISRVGRVGFVA